MHLSWRHAFIVVLIPQCSIKPSAVNRSHVCLSQASATDVTNQCVGLNCCNNLFCTGTRNLSLNEWFCLPNRALLRQLRVLDVASRVLGVFTFSPAQDSPLSIPVCMRVGPSAPMPPRLRPDSPPDQCPVLFSVCGRLSLQDMENCNFLAPYTWPPKFLHLKPSLGRHGANLEIWMESYHRHTDRQTKLETELLY